MNSENFQCSGDHEGLSVERSLVTSSCPGRMETDHGQWFSHNSLRDVKTATNQPFGYVLPRPQLCSPLYDSGMKVIFTEGSLHHLKTMEMAATPRAGEKVIVNDKFWIVKSVTHLPKQNDINDDENCCGWDDDRDADLTVHLKEDD